MYVNRPLWHQVWLATADDVKKIWKLLLLRRKHVMSSHELCVCPCLSNCHGMQCGGTINCPVKIADTGICGDRQVSPAVNTCLASRTYCSHVMLQSQRPIAARNAIPQIGVYSVSSAISLRVAHLLIWVQPANICSACSTGSAPAQASPVSA